MRGIWQKASWSSSKAGSPLEESENKICAPGGGISRSSHHSVRSLVPFASVDGL